MPSIQFVDGMYIQDNEQLPSTKGKTHVELTKSNQQSPTKANRVLAKSIQNIIPHAHVSRPNRISRGLTNLNKIRPNRVNSMVVPVTVCPETISVHSIGSEKPLNHPSPEIDSPNLPITQCDNPRYFF
jgi:hypothetical protein